MVSSLSFRSVATSGVLLAVIIIVAGYQYFTSHIEELEQKLQTANDTVSKQQSQLETMAITIDQVEHDKARLLREREFLSSLRVRYERERNQLNAELNDALNTIKNFRYSNNADVQHWAIARVPDCALHTLRVFQQTADTDQVCDHN